MAVIEKRTAQVGLDPGSAPNVQVSGALGQVVQGLGGSITNLGAAMAERKQRQQDFKDNNDYRKLQLSLGQSMTEEAENIAPDGDGFHNHFLSNVYNPARDKFLAGVSPRNREKFATMLGDEGADTTAWSIKAAEAQSGQATVWTKQQLDETANQLATYISKNPDAYDDYYQQGIDAIESAPNLTTKDRMEQKSNWSTFAQVSFLNWQMKIDPEGVLRDLGADPRFLSPTTQFSALKKALIVQETGGESDPSSAISPKGAVGTMQVMPGTAIDIAKEIKDPNFNPKWNGQQITEYLRNDVVNQRYGDYYLKKMIRQFGAKGGIEAALIGYNGGPGRAQKWIESGRDDSVIPAETSKYYKEVMARLPSMASSGPGDPKGVQLVMSRPGGMGALVKGQTEDDLNPDLVERVKTSAAALGLKQLKITSGYRSPKENERVGGAKQSQHMHGNALDIDVSGYSLAERTQLIRTLSANGITGLGIGSNIIHADTGGRRAWGYKTAAGGGEVPKWAKAAIDDHMASRATIPVGARVGGGAARFASLDYKNRQSFINAADQEVTRRYNAESKATAVQKVQLNQAMDNEVASLTRTGQSTGLVDDTTISTVLGEDDYMKWIDKKQTAQRTFVAKDGLVAMTPQEMGDRLADYEPTPGSPTYARDVQVQAAVQKEIDRVTRLRATKPDQAAMEDPTIKAAYDKAEAETAAGQVNPESVQTFVKMMLDKQKEFGLKPGTEAPVPRQWGMTIGANLAKIPEMGAKATKQQVDMMLTAQYKALYDVFGEYTDEVIIYALAEYKGVGKNTGARIAGVMASIAAGGDPLNMEFGPEYDRDAIEQSMNPGFFGTIRNFFAGDDGATPDDPGAPEPNEPVRTGGEPSAEVIQRVIGSLNGATPEEEVLIADRYGQAAVDAAKLRIAAAGGPDE